MQGGEIIFSKPKRKRCLSISKKVRVLESLEEKGLLVVIMSWVRVGPTGGPGGLPASIQGPPQGPPISLAAAGLTAPIVRDLPIRADLPKSLVRGEPVDPPPNHHPGPPKPERQRERF